MTENESVNIDFEENPFGESSVVSLNSDFPRRFTTGAAGSGKTYKYKKLCSEDPSFGILCSTTGVSAVNLGARTINSVLRFFNTESLTDSFVHGYLAKTIRTLAEDYRHIIVDEFPMMPREQLDILNEAVASYNANMSYEEKPFGIILTGDFAQLPPVKADWAFKADCWPKFAENTEKLTKPFRQNDPVFLEALNFIRSGNGGEGVETLKRTPINWSVGVDPNFDGTTIMAKNDEVDRYNLQRYMRLAGKEFLVRSYRWGKSSGEWNLIPETLKLKPGALVMILANDAEGFTYANGDLAEVVRPITNDSGETFSVEVKLKRNERIIQIPMIRRFVEQKEKPGFYFADESDWDGNGPYFDSKRRRFILGGIQYMPLRLAYAATVHKTQGLTLDRIQIDIRGHFFGQPHMAYVALSRGKKAEDIRIVGTPELLTKRIKLDPEVLPWV